METSPDSQDAEIVRLLRNNDRQAASMIFHLHHETIYNRVSMILRHREDTEDVVQNIYVALWEKRNQLTLIPPIRNYLGKMAYHYAIDFLEQRAKSNRSFVDVYNDFSDYLASPADGADRRSMMKRLREATAKLPYKTRMAYSLSRSFKLSHLEVASRMGISVKTVEMHITKAIKLLRKYLRMWTTL